MNANFIVDNVPMEINEDILRRRLRVPRESKYAPRFHEMVAKACEIGRPKGAYGLVYIEDKGKDFVVIDGVLLTSRILRVNLEKAHRVFPYVATCGTELEEWSRAFTDMLERFWSDQIKEAAVKLAIQQVKADVEERFRPGNVSAMSPGSLEDWPVSEQQGLFTILGDTADAVGVQLNGSMLMIPTKSLSGIFFPTEEAFENCQLCPREKCPGRRMPYDPGLYDRKFKPADSGND